MPLPSRRKGEDKSAFISRCMSALTRKGEGESKEQRFAICQSQASFSLADNEIDALQHLIAQYKNKKMTSKDDEGDEEETC